MKFAYQYSTLANGVRGLIVPLPSESVTALVLVKTGSRNEEDKELGISHVLEHMLFKGTKSYPTALELATAVDQMGANNNAFTGKEYTGYYITSAARHLAKSLAILGEMVREPTLPADDLEREKEVIVEEINMYEDQPMERASEEWENLIYEGSRMGRLIIGTKETVRAVRREDLEDYRRRWYRGGNVLVVVVGGGRAEETAEMLVEHFGGLSQGEIEAYVEPASYGLASTRQIVKKTEQAHLVLGTRAVAMTDERRYALQVAQVILGGNMSSRLFNEIREKRGWAYYVRSMLDTSFDVGYLAVRAGIRLAYWQEARELIREQLLGLGATVTHEEVERAKEYLLGKIPLSLEGTMEVAQTLGLRALIMDKVMQPAEVMQKIKQTSWEQVKQVLGEVVREEEVKWVVVAPQGE